MMMMKTVKGWSMFLAAIMLASVFSFSTAALSAADIDAVTASGTSTPGYEADKTIDGNLGTRWALEGDGQWIRYELSADAVVDAVSIAWYLGDARTSEFDIDVSLDGSVWTSAGAGWVSSGTTAGLETYDIPNAPARYVRITGHGNSANDWISICETEIETVQPVLDESFDSTATDSLPSGWTADASGGAVGVKETPDSADKSLSLHDTSASGKVTAYKAFDAAATGETTAEFKMMAAQTNAVHGISLRNAGGTSAVTVAFDLNGYIYTYDGTTKTNVQAYAANAWYTVKIAADPATHLFDLYIDGVQKLGAQHFRNDVDSFNNVYLNSSTADTGITYWNDVLVATSDVASDAVPFSLNGNVKARSAAEISGSNWSIGGETLDRDYAVYDNYKAYLGPLGAKKIRLQGGWAKTETTAGVYDWTWLDNIVNDAVSQGIQPWIETSYGNTIYSGGGGTGLGGGIPTSAAALTAWDNWVGAMVARYQNDVDEWEIWNEPDGHVNATDYADFFVRTAEIIRSVQPSSKIYALALANTNLTYVNTFLTRVQQLNKLDLITAITYHKYTARPESHYSAVQNLRDTIADYSSTITVRQGENGAPSQKGGFGALSGGDWTELKQAKWDLRRLLGDLGRDIPSNCFTIIDLKYSTGWNSKGLLKANTDKTVAYAKPAYYAVQNLTAIFDDTLTRIPNYSYTDNTSSELQLFAYGKNGTNKQVVTLWLSGAEPSDSNGKTPVDFTFQSGNFSDPVYVDLRDGKVYEIPDANWSVSGTTYTFTSIPVYDSPILIADKSVITLQ